MKPPLLRFVLAAGLLWSLAPPPEAWASSPAPMPPLATLLSEGAEKNPGVAAARARYEAARARVAGQGLLPDPMVEAGAMSLWGMMGPEVAVTQAFPLGGKLDFERRAAEAEVAIARQAYRQALNGLLAEIRTAYYDLFDLQQAAALVARNKELLGQMSKTAAARYAVGQGKQSDVVRANTQLAEMLHEAVIVRQQRESASAKLMGLLNRPFDPTHLHAPEGAIATPAVAPYKRTIADVLEAASRRNPAILQAEAELAAGEVALAAARTIATPDVTARLGLGQSYMGMDWQTAVSGMVGTSLPLQSRDREAAAVAAAEAELEARRLNVENQRRQVRVGVHQALSHVRHLDEQVRLYTQGILPQARQALKAELANYQVGRSDFDAVINAQMSLYRYEREHQQAIAEYQKMLAEIDQLTAEGLPALEETP